MGRFITDRDTVENSIRNNGWVVAFGRELTYQDAATGLVASGVSIYTSNPAAVMAWLDDLVTQCVQTMGLAIAQTFTPTVRNVAESFAVNVIRGLLSGQVSGESFQNLTNTQFKAGVAKFTGQNQEWNPIANLGNLSNAGEWENLGPPVISLCPYVGIQVPSVGSGGGIGLRIGQIQIVNDYGGDVNIFLYHPQNPGTVFANWHVLASQSTFLALATGTNITIGSDWGIQIKFGNGVTSQIRKVGNIGSFNGSFSVLATRIENG